MKKVALFLLIIMLTACTSEKEQAPVNQKDKQEARETNQSENRKVIAENLDIPWNITKVEEVEDTFYLSQRGGSIQQVDGETGRTVLQNINVTKDIVHAGEGGFLGFILAPDFESTNEALAYHTYEQEGSLYNRVIRLQLQEDTWVETGILLEGIPGGQIHNGGRLKIGPDQKLYVTTGDAGEADLAQDLHSLGGKILRMELDGSIPSDNPFSNSYVYSYGHRNPQGLAWDKNGQLYSTEHGQTAHDEINRIEPGNNYGWPVIQGDEEKAGMIPPFYHTGNTTWAPSGIDSRKGKLYIAALRGTKIIAFDINTKEQTVIYDQGDRVRDIFIQNDSLYAITNNRDGRGTPKEGDDRLMKINLETEG
ncbi:PQQ-dependent sugar dehydrogenase [Virgibacillus sp. MSP4-1]|uniref:PQQ-dependent sugar dehydrogenase n=1 Tax=Virgibacillus sp. MSP4-1 TaxID=2700081 RepID=UPI0005C64102|nr:PQQ-dependent sugar dehydrogenase [Virgibacillus sp. MSP4-1]QHS23178.1 PQQ-dependent sugar dehydrogenase [Virgibacillus sp. MSP4-1]